MAIARTLISSMKFITCLLLVLLLLLSCSPADKPGAQISWWQFWTSPDVAPTIRQLAAEFETANPGIGVELGELTWSDGHEKIVISLAAGKGPDVVELGSDWVAEFAAAGRLLEIGDRVADLSVTLQMWEPASYEGKIYGVPWMLGTRVLFVNRGLLTRAGYSSDFKPSDWEQLLQAAQAINGLGEGVYGFGSNSAERHRLYKKFLPFFWSAGGVVFDSAQTQTLFDSEAGRKSLDYYLSLSQAGLIESQSRLDDHFTSGNLAFVISGEWLVKKLERSHPDLDYFVQLIPAPDSGTNGISFAGGEYLVVNAATDNPEAAIALIRYLSQPEQNARFCRAAGNFTPANREAVSVSDSSLVEIAALFRRQLESSRSTPVHPAWVYLEEAIEKGIEKALYGQLGSRAALEEIDKRCNEILSGHEGQ